MRPAALVALLLWLTACGSSDEAAPRARQPALRVVFSQSGAWAPQAATAPAAPPVTLVFRFVGPDGAMEQRIAYETGRLEVDDLRIGTWQTEAEGLDAKGLVTWHAAKVVFEVREDRTTEVDLVFIPL